tara:strand:+ start:387 stop:851 length:465 start_codon:yes stop_codon:yes gene_type:complete
MYPLYSDKPNLFECSIDLEGCSLEQASARLIIESEQNSLVFNGEIDNSGACLIPVKKLKGLVSEGGTLKLEVIADDMYFCPWESEYELSQSKKVTVEVKSPNNKPKLVENKKPKVNISFKKPTSQPKKQKRVVKETKREYSKSELQSLLKRLRG